jgi:hypothetical protein
MIEPILWPFGQDAVGELFAVLLAHLGLKPKANSSSPLKRTEDLAISAF